jgi:methylated-DNA-[protein]-cysteine S-methyltransferase
MRVPRLHSSAQHAEITGRSGSASIRSRAARSVVPAAGPELPADAATVTPAASGALTGYAGGLDAKRFLLDLEARPAS